MKQTAGQFLREARKALNMTPYDVSAATGISRSRLEWIENDRRKMLDLRTCAKLCDHYRVSLLVLAAIAEGKPLVKGL